MLQKPVYGIAESYIFFLREHYYHYVWLRRFWFWGFWKQSLPSIFFSNEDVNDSDGDGISGKANYVHDPISNTVALGRFGWKANTATILEQCAGAYLKTWALPVLFFQQKLEWDKAMEMMEWVMTPKLLWK